MTKTHQNFLSKLEVISGGRDTTPFLKSIGLSSGTLDRLKKGSPVSGDTLSSLQRVANANIRWLTTEIGEPFNYTKLLSDTDGLEFVSQLADETWTVYLVVSGESYCSVLTMPAQLERKELVIDYTVVEILTGNLGPSTRRAIVECAHDGAVYKVEASPDELARLAHGRMSNSELLGYEDKRKSRPGLLDRKVEIDPEEITNPRLRVKDELGSYDVEQGANAETELLTLFRAMDASKKRQVLEMMKVLSG